MTASNFTESEQNLLLTIRDTYRNIALRWIERRRADAGPLPPGVEEKRKSNDELHAFEKYIKEMHSDIIEVKKNTALVPKIANVFRNMFAKGAGDFDEYVNDKKKK